MNENQQDAAKIDTLPEQNPVSQKRPTAIERLQTLRSILHSHDKTFTPQTRGNIHRRTVLKVGLGVVIGMSFPMLEAIHDIEVSTFKELLLRTEQERPEPNIPIYLSISRKAPTKDNTIGIYGVGNSIEKGVCYQHTDTGGVGDIGFVHDLANGLNLELQLLFKPKEEPRLSSHIDSENPQANFVMVEGLAQTGADSSEIIRNIQKVLGNPIEMSAIKQYDTRIFCLTSVENDIANVFTRLKEGKISIVQLPGKLREIYDKAGGITRDRQGNIHNKDIKKGSIYAIMDATKQLNQQIGGNQTHMAILGLVDFSKIPVFEHAINKLPDFIQGYISDSLSYFSTVLINNLIKEACEVQHITYVGLHGKIMPSFFCSQDGFHPSKEGYAAIAKLFMQKINVVIDNVKYSLPFGN